MQIAGAQMNRIVFMGTPEFAVPILQRLADRLTVVGVFTQPDKPAGRGQHLAAPPVKLFAQERGLSIFQPRTLRDEVVQAQLAALEPDVIVVAAFGLLLPQAVLDLPPHGCVNVHASLLPRYRGAAPIPAVILNGEAETGITLMRMDEGLDTGPTIAQGVISILEDDTTGTLTTRLAELGARMAIEVLPHWIAGDIMPQPQAESRATLAPKLKKAEGRLDWSDSAIVLDRRVRAFSPRPGTFTTWNGKLLRVLSVQLTNHPSEKAGEPELPGTPGLVVKAGNDIRVATGDRPLELVQIQLEGKRAMSAQDFARGQPTFIGSVLGGD
jgi:methionyl-tRNA formyltransferase